MKAIKTFGWFMATPVLGGAYVLLCYFLLRLLCEGIKDIF